MAKTRRISDQSMAVLGGMMDGRLNFEDFDTSEQELAFEQFLARMGRPNKRLHSAMGILRRDAGPGNRAF